MACKEGQFDVVEIIQGMWMEWLLYFDNNILEKLVKNAEV